MTDLQVQARALGDPTRHAVFRYLAESDQPVGIAELTRHFGLNHNAIRQHLAKLVAAGLVVGAKAPTTGPGRAPHVFSVDPNADSRWGTVGPYERLAQLLVEVISSGRSAEEVGRAAGEALADGDLTADAVDRIAKAMARQGFAPEVERSGDRIEIVLHNCPFESAARADRATVCSLHLGISEGLADGTTVVVEELVAHDPRRAGCRLRLRVDPADPAGTTSSASTASSGGSDGSAGSAAADGDRDGKLSLRRRR